MIMKRYKLLLICIVLAAALPGCGSDGPVVNEVTDIANAKIAAESIIAGMM